MLLTNQESCVMNGCSTKSYFKLEKGTRQGDPISAYLIKIIEQVNIFENRIADDTAFLSKTKIL